FSLLCLLSFFVLFSIIFITRYQHEALPTRIFTKFYSLENKIFIIRFLPSNSVTRDVSKALGPRGIKPELIKESTKFKPKICPITPSVSAKPEPYSRRNQQCIQPEAKPRRFSAKPKHSSDRK
ncbi:hypothetical protein LINPERPRIM_LOCUS20334, partial [Linum perenne]